MIAELAIETRTSPVDLLAIDQEILDEMIDVLVERNRAAEQEMKIAEMKRKLG